MHAFWKRKRRTCGEKEGKMIQDEKQEDENDGYGWKQRVLSYKTHYPLYKW